MQLWHTAVLNKEITTWWGAQSPYRKLLTLLRLLSWQGPNMGLPPWQAKALNSYPQGVLSPSHQGLSIHCPRRVGPPPLWESFAWVTHDSLRPHEV